MSQYPYGGGQYQNQGQYPNQGQGQYPNQTQYPNQGQGQYPNQGQGQYPNQGQYTGQGQYPSQTQYSNQGQYNNAQPPYQQQPQQTATGPPPAYDEKKRPTSPRKSKQTINDPQTAPQQQQQQQPNQAPTEQQPPQVDHDRYAGTKKQGDKICGCGKKMCLIIGVVGGIIGLLILIGIIVGIVMAVKGSGGDADDGMLKCQCSGGPHCSKPNFGKPSFEKCTSKDQMCYAKYKYRRPPQGDIVEAGCKSNPQKKKCIRDKDQFGSPTVDECWCTYKECFKYTFTLNNACEDACRDGTADLSERS